MAAKFFALWVCIGYWVLLMYQTKLIQKGRGKRQTHFELSLINPRDTIETIESGPLCITDLFKNKSVAYF